MINEKPWLKKYDPGISTCLHYPDLCIHDLLNLQVDRNPDHIAIVDGDRQIDYWSLHRNVNNFAKHLIHKGVEVGDRVGICLPNSIEFAIAFLGTLAAGGIVAAMNPQFPVRELEFQVRKIRPKWMVSLDTRVEDFTTMMNNGLFDQLAMVDQPIENSFVFCKGWEENGCVLFSEMINDLDHEFKFPDVKPSMPAVFQFSGGTTGFPKAAIGTHKNIVSNVTQFKNWLVNLREGCETFLVAIPLYHVYGMVLGLNLGIAMGARMVFVRDPRNIENLLSLIEKYNVSYFPGVPSTFNMINLHPGVAEGKFNLSMIKACISGSAPLPESVRTLFENTTGGHLVEGYGLSEAPTATHCNPILGEKRNGSIGLPLPDVECRIVSMDGLDNDAVQGESGELLIRAPQVMLAYYDDEAETAKVLKDGWLHTGDIARMDEDGYFYIVGRAKDLIKVHGMQVWPNEVEEVMAKYPGIKECVVAGVPDEKSGERVKIWIVSNDSGCLSISAIRDYCKDKFGGYKIPAEVEIIESIPRSPVGKILRRELVKRHLEMQK